MKVEQVKETFTPIKLEITIESEAEFWDLYHRINASNGTINKGLPESYKYLADNNLSFNLYKELDNIREVLVKKK